MNGFKAAQVLYRNGNKKEAIQVLQSLWETPEPETAGEFQVFCALVEVWISNDAYSVLGFLDSVIAGQGSYHGFWLRRTLAEQATLLDLHGQIAFHLEDMVTTFESLSRAASLGRDTSLIWRQLGTVYILNGELDLGLRYIRRSLHLFRQLDLDLLSGRDEPLGAFTGENPLGATHDLEDYLVILLRITKLAKGQRNLKSVRELVLEMIHQFPDESRLPKIRLLLEKAIVESSLSIAKRPSALPPSEALRVQLAPPQGK